MRGMDGEISEGIEIGRRRRFKLDKPFKGSPRWRVVRYQGPFLSPRTQDELLMRVRIASQKLSRYHLPGRGLPVHWS